ncbi:ATP-binding protein [Streptomyces sp. NPDC048577]|uniref:ATP-binding protein n=1 Tax=Streptomyces sp. NPDC048577 TaxID=3157209 RepID=UPI003415E279
MITTSARVPAGDRTDRAPTKCSRALCVAAASASSVRRMRHFVRYCVRRLGLPESTCDTACLVVSELVTNAVLHSGSRSVAVLVGIGPGHLLITVRDCGRWRERDGARRSTVDDDAPCGRGLELVRALTDRCTVTSGPGGTVAVARVRLTPGTAVPATAVAVR